MEYIDIYYLEVNEFLSETYLINLKMTFKTFEENVDNCLLTCFERNTYLKMSRLQAIIILKIVSSKNQQFE